MNKFSTKAIDENYTVYTRIHMTKQKNVKTKTKTKDKNFVLNY